MKLVIPTTVVGKCQLSNSFARIKKLKLVVMEDQFLWFERTTYMVMDLSNVE